MKAALVVVLLGLGSGMIQAQDQAVPHPQAPYLAPVPNNGHWKISFKSVPDPTAKPGETPPPPLNTVEVIKTGNLRQVTLSLPNLPPRVYYEEGDWIVTLNPQNDRQPQLLIPSPSHQPYPFYTEGFTLMEGIVISPATFTGVVKYNEQPTFHYQGSAGEVWIAPATMLPIAIKAVNGSLIAEFTFLPAPSQPVQIPPEQNDLLKKTEAAYQNTRAMR